MTAGTVICICVVASIMGALADDLPPQVDDVPPQPLPKDRVLEMLQSMKSSADRAARSTLQSAKSGAERAARALSPYTPDVVKRNPKASVAVAAGTTALLGTLLATRKSAANPPVKPAPKRSAEQSKIAQLKNSISVDKYKVCVQSPVVPMTRV